MGFLPAIWGDMTWKDFHFTIEHASKDEQLTFEDLDKFVKAFFHMLACGGCIVHIFIHLSSRPLPKQKEKWIEWGIAMHNDVNIQLGKPILSTNDAIKLMEDPLNTNRPSLKHVLEATEFMILSSSFLEEKTNKEKEQNQTTKRRIMDFFYSFIRCFPHTDKRSILQNHVKTHPLEFHTFTTLLNMWSRLRFSIDRNEDGLLNAPRTVEEKVSAFNEHSTKHFAAIAAKKQPISPEIVEQVPSTNKSIWTRFKNWIYPSAPATTPVVVAAENDSNITLHLESQTKPRQYHTSTTTQFSWLWFWIIIFFVLVFLVVLVVLSSKYPKTSAETWDVEQSQMSPIEPQIIPNSM